MPNPYTKLLDRIKDIGRLQSVVGLLGWDQETYMPKNGVTARAEQFALLTGLAHQWLVADETRKCLDEATAAPDDFVAQTNIRETQRLFDRAVKVPTKLVKEIASSATVAKEVWTTARQNSDFAEFRPHLEKLVDLKKQEAECVGYETEPYDALMDEFEPGLKAADVEQLFAELREQTVALLDRIVRADHKPDPSILHRGFDVDEQARWSRRLAEALAFDFTAGRIDVSVHPFCTTIGGCGDVRITTRYQRDFLSSALFGTMHETGHALYEQGLLSQHRHTPMGHYVSLGLHESQSRLWENLIGRSRPFWYYHFHDLKTTFPQALDRVSLDDFYGAINLVRPSPIRVEADELTYNLHIILRFEIERALFDGSLEVHDVPAAWNEKFNASLGIEPPDDREGCLQDIHWAWASFGYFHTYTLGNLYAAQLFAKANKDIPELDDRIAANDHQPLLTWLRTHIHCHGQRYRAADLVKLVTGEPLTIRPFIDYATTKFSDIYKLT
ncbi:MAG: carboxypeptidase M32 [Phycisphaerae bacterium]|jgi:carboxypeptidase Taq